MREDVDAVKKRHDQYKLTCERCGSLTIALPVDSRPDPHAILKCGRCGSPRGTLQSLRDRSVDARSSYME
jgi:transcription elongation factor Elf1